MSSLTVPLSMLLQRPVLLSLDLSDEEQDMQPLFETILDYIPAPEGDPEAPTQVLISTIDYNEYVGRIGVGKVDNGTISVNQDSGCCKPS